VLTQIFKFPAQGESNMSKKYKRQIKGKRGSYKEAKSIQHKKLRDGEPDWNDECIVCGESPTVHPTNLCGPCCFGEADTYGGNW
jgi:hypothetical protein